MHVAIHQSTDNHLLPRALLSKELTVGFDAQVNEGQRSIYNLSVHYSGQFFVTNLPLSSMEGSEFKFDVRALKKYFTN